MKPRRLDSETIVSRLATAGWTSLGSAVGEFVTRGAPMARGLGMDTGGRTLDGMAPMLADAPSTTRRPRRIARPYAPGEKR